MDGWPSQFDRTTAHTLPVFPLSHFLPCSLRNVNSKQRGSGPPHGLTISYSSRRNDAPSPKSPTVALSWFTHAAAHSHASPNWLIQRWFRHRRRAVLFLSRVCEPTILWSSSRDCRRRISCKYNVKNLFLYGVSVYWLKVHTFTRAHFSLLFLPGPCLAFSLTQLFRCGELFIWAYKKSSFSGEDKIYNSVVAFWNYAASQPPGLLASHLFSSAYIIVSKSICSKYPNTLPTTCEPRNLPQNFLSLEEMDCRNSFRLFYS